MSDTFITDQINFGAAGVQAKTGAADPSAGAGVAAPLGSIYLRSSGSLWVKTGAGATAWTSVTAGTAGAQGPAGPAVFLDADGAEGEMGPPGPAGAAGAAGPPGAGATGAQGPAGPAVFLDADGAEGEMGPPGAAGTAGAEGAPGTPGTAGAQGPAGPAVFLDADGAEGEMGPPGAAGNAGTLLATANTYTASQSVAASALTDAATVATNAALSNSFTLTIGGNRTLGTPTNLVAGQTVIWVITQDGAGGRTLAYNAAFKWPGGVAPVLSTAIGAVDMITGYVLNSSNILCTMQKAYA